VGGAALKCGVAPVHVDLRSAHVETVNMDYNLFMHEWILVHARGPDTGGWCADGLVCCVW